MSLPTHINRKQGYREHPKKTTNKATLKGELVQPKYTTPRSEVTVEFAAKQFFQILLVDIKYRNAKLNNDLEIVTVPFAGIQRKINIEDKGKL